MERQRQLSRVFIGLFILFWLIGPLTQLIQIIDLDLHVRMGFSEAVILDPEFGWLKADELAIAWADMGTLIAGVIFVIGAVKRRPWSIWFGFYSLAVWSYWPILTLVRWTTLEDSGYSVFAEGQEFVFRGFMLLVGIFSLVGMFYLWRRRRVFE